MNIFLTGSTGFVGSYILANLIQSGHKLTIYKRPSSDLRRIKQYIKEIKIVDKLEELSEENNIDCIIHAATTYETGNYAGSNLLSSNINLPVYLLDFAINTNCLKFINISTFIAKYASVPPNRYALTKRNFEQWGAFYSNFYSLNFVNVTLHQAYGVDDNPNKFIPWLVSEIKNNAEKIDLTKGEQERDFINVVDVASAVAKIVTENGAYYEEYEVGTGNITNLKEFAKLVKKLANSSTKLNFGIKEYRDFEIMKLNTDSTKLKKLGWSPSLSLEEGISQMLDNF